MILTTTKEPWLDDDKTVFENVLDGLPEERAKVLTEYYQIKEKLEQEGSTFGFPPHLK